MHNEEVRIKRLLPESDVEMLRIALDAALPETGLQQTGGKARPIGRGKRHDDKGDSHLAKALRGSGFHGELRKKSRRASKKTGPRVDMVSNSNKVLSNRQGGVYA